MPSFRVSFFVGCLAILAFFAGGRANAFPEMIRHGYASCVTCHHSPNGGGVLTDYGRALSQQVLSTWGAGDDPTPEGEFAYGVLPKIPSTSFGGDFRSVQVWTEDSKRRTGRFIFMQADVEGAFTVGGATAVATLGYDPVLSQPLSRRHYATYRLAPDKPYMIRAGRFFPAYGLNMPDHAPFIRQQLGLSVPAGETYNLELTYLGENLNVFGTWIIGSTAGTTTAPQGASLRGSYFFAERYEVGMSYLFASRPTGITHTFGPSIALGFTPHFFLLGEMDFALKNPGEATQKLAYGHYVRLNWEFLQGLHGYLVQENYIADISTADLRAGFGAGLQFFPRPHFEFRLEYQRRSDADGTDYGWGLAHFYL